MTPTSPPIGDVPVSRRTLSSREAFLILAALVGAAYGSTLFFPFIFDDLSNIVGNGSIRSLWPLGPVLAPPDGLGVAGRPVVNFSLTLNYLASGLDPWSYRLFNIGVHLVAGWVLFLLVRHTLEQSPRARELAPRASGLAMAPALIWTLHPIQTQAVTYAIQRCESLMGLFVLLTLYMAARGLTNSRPRPWFLAAALFLLLADGSKEVAAAAPVLVILFVRRLGPWKAQADRRSMAWLYGGMALGLAALVLLAAAGGTYHSGLHRRDLAWFPYAITQSQVVLHYLWLALWPSRLVIDYGWPAASISEAAPYLVVIVVLLGLTGWALARRPGLGFLAGSFFIVLGPSSSFMPLPDLAFEHRMYLALAPLCVLAVLAGQAAMVRYGGEGEAGRRVGIPVVAVLSMVLAFLAWERNREYRHGVILWADAAAKRPNNARAWTNLGGALVDLGRLDEAEIHLTRAVKTDPSLAMARYNLGTVRLKKGDAAGALAFFDEALRLDPDYAPAWTNRGAALMFLGRWDEAAGALNAALARGPGDADANANRGAVSLALSRPDEALNLLRRALILLPDHPAGRTNLALALERTGNLGAAEGEYRRALAVYPDSVPAWLGLGRILEQTGRPAEAGAAYVEAVRLAPRSVPGRRNLGRLLAASGQPETARRFLESALALAPEDRETMEILRSLETAG